MADNMTVLLVAGHGIGPNRKIPSKHKYLNNSKTA